MTVSCTEVVERKFSICIEIWQVELESCVWRVSFHKYAYVHGDPIQGIDPTGMFVESQTLFSVYQSLTAAFAAVSAFASLKAAVEHFSYAAQSTTTVAAFIHEGIALLNLALAALDVAVLYRALSMDPTSGFQLAGNRAAALSINAVAVAYLTRLALVSGMTAGVAVQSLLTGQIILSTGSSQLGPEYNNWTWQRPTNPSPTHPDLPKYGPDNWDNTFGVFQGEGKFAWLKSDPRGPSQFIQQAIDRLGPQVSHLARHVEFHAVGIMRKLGIKKASVTINRPKGGCEGVNGCLENVSKVMKEGEELTVVSENVITTYTRAGSKTVPLK
jgi:hypothetical protein